MSAKRKPASGEGHTSDYQQVVELMREMGSKHGFDPIPPTQYRWMMAPDMPRLFRFMGWMFSRTIAWGHRSAYAVDKEGNEQRIEHANADLQFDSADDAHGCANTREVLEEAIELGLVRKGTKEEGRRRLYLCGEVNRQKPIADEYLEFEANKKRSPVCTNRIPPYILLKIREWPDARRKEFIVGHFRLSRAQKDAHAELMLVFREAIDQLEDTYYRGFGLEKKRLQPRAAAGEPADVAAKQQRLDGLAEHVLRFVQTVNDSVQSDETTLYTPPEPSVQTDSAGPTLLPAESTENTETRGGRDSSLSAIRKPSEPLPVDEGEAAKYLPSPELPQLGTAEAEAENLLFSELKRMQEAFEHTEFAGEEISSARKCDRVTVRRIVNTVGAENMTQFLLWVIAKFKGLDRNALGKKLPRAPGTQHGPRSLGLIVAWAADYAGKLAEGARPQIDPRRRAGEIRACQAIVRSHESTPADRDAAAGLLKAHGAAGGRA